MKGTRGLKWLRLAFALLLPLGLQAPLASSVAAGSSPQNFCKIHPYLCVDNVPDGSASDQYIGHDEPSLLFYSDVPGSGNSSRYVLRLPNDPPTAPVQDGTGGTASFQLHPAFWVGMAMCDTQSAPEYTSTCVPDSDTNIADNRAPSAPDYIGRHPGTAFMEMQLYPPGWVKWSPGNSCDPVKWCAALNIDSYQQNLNNGQLNNTACQNRTGPEPVNFAFITTDGKAQAPANPLDTNYAKFTPDPTRDLFMSSGDSISIDLHDTPDGFQVQMLDLTTGESGSMTAGIANGFGQVVWDPSGSTCTQNPYAFHPMYSTSSVHTRVPWAAHTYNVAFSDEIGHFEYCAGVAGPFGSCTVGGASDGGAVDADDNYCFAPPFLPPTAATQIGGCYAEPTSSTQPPFDTDFDSVSYGLNWAGTLANSQQDSQLHAQPIMFQSPRFNGGTMAYAQVGFETDLPRIEADAPTNPCLRWNGTNCVNPPTGAAFYPIFTTTSVGGQCYWQLGGSMIPGTTNTFGGTSTTEYGAIEAVVYPNTGWVPITILEDFRRIMPNNPC